ncbi:MAG: hypothetical protein PHE06_00765 [Lachnospiraceae bacterium]|nr:hypothetical protein [Lachnospiraceae bacterium]
MKMKKATALMMTAAIGAAMFTVPVFAEEAETEPANTVSGDSTAEDAFVIWGWNEDIKKILDGPFAEAYPDLYKRIVFVNTGGSDTYQTKVDAILEDPSGELYPDLMGLEVDYVLKYVNGDFLSSVGDLGITADDYANQYGYSLDLGTDYDGNVKALFWQATPGCIQIRADLAEKYLGTTDQATLSEMFSSWDNILDTARKVNEASGGTAKLFSGYDEMFRIFSNSRANGWYDENDTIQVDENMTKYMEMAKTCYEEELTYNTQQWKDDWYANMAGDGETSNAAVAYCGCPWFTYWCLGDAWKANTILVQAPEQFYWGGTGLAATAGCADTDMAATILKFFTCETDPMVSINALNSDFVNNKEAVQKIADAGTTCDYIYGDQDMISFYLPMADGIDAKNATAEDQDINSLWTTQVDAYARGEKDLDTAVADFKSSVHDTFSYLNVE